MYDVFLSYNSEDLDAASLLSGGLESEGLVTFFDRDFLSPGKNWISGLEQALDRSKSVAVLLGPRGLGKWQRPEVHLALDRHHNEDDFPVIPVLLPGNTDPPTGFLKLNTWVDLRQEFNPEEGAALLKSALVGDVANSQTYDPSSEICPYRGLLPFREEDSPFYFGREHEVSELQRKVIEQKLPLVGVVGCSGSGKSSLVHAGLLPKLRDARKDESWEIFTIRPKKDPLRAVAKAFSPPSEGLDSFLRTEWLVDRADKLRTRKVSVVDLVEDALGRGERSDRVLLFVDQWEELYSQTERSSDPGLRRQSIQDRETFIAGVLECCDHPRCSVVLTVRADFYDQILSNERLTGHFDRNGISLGPMSADSLRLCIERPAEAAGYGYADGLVDRILKDAKQEPGYLPLLEYLLQELWKKNESRTFTHAAYDEAGGVAKALAQRAEREYQTIVSRGDENLVAATRRVFVSLVTPGEGREDTRAYIPVPKHEPESTVVRHFSAQSVRLITANEDSIEVSHEALIQQWKRLRDDWLDSNREQLRIRARVREAMATWREEGEAQARLLAPGKALEEAKDLLANHGDVLTDDISRFVQLSSQAERAQKHRVFATASVIFLAMMTLAAWALHERSDAVAARESAEGIARTSFLRTIGTSSSLSFDGKEALWELASLDEGGERIRSMLVEEWTSDIQAYNRATRDRSHGLNAAVGLSVERQMQMVVKSNVLLDSILARIKAGASSGEMRSLTLALEGIEGYLDQDELGRLAEVIIEEMGNSVEPGKLSALGQALGVVVDRIPDNIDYASPLVESLCSAASEEQVTTLKSALSMIGDSGANSHEIDRLIARSLTACEDFGRMADLLAVSAGFEPPMDPQLARSMTDSVLHGLTHLREKIASSRSYYLQMEQKSKSDKTLRSYRSLRGSAGALYGRLPSEQMAMITEAFLEPVLSPTRRVASSKFAFHLVEQVKSVDDEAAIAIGDRLANAVREANDVVQLGGAASLVEVVCARAPDEVVLRWVKSIAEVDGDPSRDFTPERILVALEILAKAGERPPTWELEAYRAVAGSVVQGGFRRYDRTWVEAFERFAEHLSAEERIQLAIWVTNRPSLYRDGAQLSNYLRALDVLDEASLGALLASLFRDLGSDSFVEKVDAISSVISKREDALDSSVFASLFGEVIEALAGNRALVHESQIAEAMAEQMASAPPGERNTSLDVLVEGLRTDHADKNLEKLRDIAVRLVSLISEDRVATLAEHVVGRMKEATEPTRLYLLSSALSSLCGEEHVGMLREGLDVVVSSYTSALSSGELRRMARELASTRDSIDPEHYRGLAATVLSDLDGTKVGSDIVPFVSILHSLCADSNTEVTARAARLIVTRTLQSGTEFADEKKRSAMSILVEDAPIEVVSGIAGEVIDRLLRSDESDEIHLLCRLLDDLRPGLTRNVLAGVAERIIDRLGSSDNPEDVEIYYFALSVTGTFLPPETRMELCETAINRLLDGADRDDFESLADRVSELLSLCPDSRPIETALISIMAGSGQSASASGDGDGDATIGSKPQSFFFLGDEEVVWSAGRTDYTAAVTMLARHLPPEKAGIIAIDLVERLRAIERPEDASYAGAVLKALVVGAELDVDVAVALVGGLIGADTPSKVQYFGEALAPVVRGLGGEDLSRVAEELLSVDRSILESLIRSRTGESGRGWWRSVMGRFREDIVDSDLRIRIALSDIAGFQGSLKEEFRGYGERFSDQEVLKLIGALLKLCVENSHLARYYGEALLACAEALPERLLTGVAEQVVIEIERGADDEDLESMLAELVELHLLRYDGAVFCARALVHSRKAAGVEDYCELIIRICKGLEEDELRSIGNLMLDLCERETDVRFLPALGAVVATICFQLGLENPEYAIDLVLLNDSVSHFWTGMDGDEGSETRVRGSGTSLGGIAKRLRDRSSESGYFPSSWESPDEFVAAEADALPPVGIRLDLELFERFCLARTDVELVEILKWPFCVGDAEEILMRILSDKLAADGLRLDPDSSRYQFVVQAEALGRRDLHLPARRPKAAELRRLIAGRALSMGSPSSESARAEVAR